MESLSGDADVGAVTRGVAGGTVAGMGAEQSKTGTSGLQTRNLRVLGKTESLLERPKLKFSYNNLKFGQNKSCRGRKDLQHWYWIKVVLINDLRDKIGSKEDQS